MKIPLQNIPKFVYFTHVPHGKIKFTYIYEVLSIIRQHNQIYNVWNICLNDKYIPHTTLI